MSGPRCGFSSGSDSIRGGGRLRAGACGPGFGVVVGSAGGGDVSVGVVSGVVSTGVVAGGGAGVVSVGVVRGVVSTGAGVVSVVVSVVDAGGTVCASTGRPPVASAVARMAVALASVCTARAPGRRR